jgi:NAD(P)-dependent dehydrogenase (short-subunit alcohol dehydrogenase family)
MQKFQDKVAVIINSHSPTGDAIRNTLEKEGATVRDIHTPTLGKNTTEKVFYAKENYTRLDIVIVIADSMYRLAKPIVETSLEEFRAVNRRNMETAFLATKQSVIKMREFGNGGAIVHITPLTGMKSYLGQAALSASSNGVKMMTKGAALSCCEAGDNIRINHLQVGKINDGLAQEVMTNTTVPLSQEGRPQDIANAVSFLVSKESKYITGYSLTLDGGMIAA